MQRWLFVRSIVVKRLRLLALISAAALLPACERPSEDPDAKAARDIQKLVVVEPFGEAALTIDKNIIEADSPTGSEAGFSLRPAKGVRKPVIVEFSYDDPTPLNLRLTNEDGYDYQSASGESRFLLGPDAASEALFYGAGPLDFTIEIASISACNEDNQVCLQNGDVQSTFGSADLKNRVLIDKYSSAQIENVGQRTATIIRGADSGEYGVTFTLAPGQGNKNFVLEFAVDQPEQVQLSVKRGGQLRYHSATRGWARLNADTEALLFTGATGAFRIEDVKLVDCETGDWRCKTIEDFEALLPGDPADTGLGKAIELTEWVTKNADFALSGSVANDMQLTGLTPSQIYYRYYEPSVGGGFCGATAAFLARTLRSQGFQAFTFDFGVKDDNLTHVTTIVSHDGFYYLMDATFGGYFVRPGSNQPLDLFSILDGAPYAFRTLDMGRRDFIVDKSDKDRLARMKYASVLENCRSSPGQDVIVCERPGFGLDAYLESFGNELRDNGLEGGPETLLELMRRGVFNIGDGQDTDAMRTFARQLDARGITLVEVPGQTSPRRLLQD